MKIFSDKTKSVEIQSFEQWKKVFIKKDTNSHWKEGRSACSLAHFICDNCGEEQIIKKVNSILQKDEVESLDEGIIEFENKFDDFRNGRIQDLSIWGKTKKGKKIYIGVEAKVDEKFDNKTLKDAFEYAKKYLKEHPKSGNLTRINNLCNFFKVNVETAGNLMYQLFYYVAGTLSEPDQDIYIMLVLVFKTKEYDPQKGENNKKDYNLFMNRFATPKDGYYSFNTFAKQAYSTYMEVTLE